MLRRGVSQHVFSSRVLATVSSIAYATAAALYHAGPATSHRSLPLRRSRGVCTPLISGARGVSCTRRALHTVTSAANFEAEVVQSELAVCVVYYIPHSSNCTAYLKTAERLVDELNAEAGEMFPGLKEANPETEVTSGEGVEVDEVAGKVAGSQPQGTTVVGIDLSGDTSTAKQSENAKSDKKKKTASQWLKLCIINADENRNLASAFSVERAKLPLTYFVMQGTIIDKVVGHISEVRLKSILYNFLTHYQKEMNVDLMAKSSATYSSSRGSSSPLPSAEKADLLQASASSRYLKDKILSSLVGSERIALPEEAEHLDGLRKLVQDGKRRAHSELQDLYHKLGMDVRRLSDAEMHQHYYRSEQFATVGVISALEALFLAREYAAIGDISRDNVEWARRAVQKDFEPILGHAEVRKVLALVEAVTLRGDVSLALRGVTVELQTIVSSLTAMQEQNEAGATPSSPSSSAFLQQRLQQLQEQHRFLERLVKVIDNHVDARVLDEEFPSAAVDALFADLKASIQLRNLKRREKQQQQQTPGNVASAEWRSNTTSGGNSVELSIVKLEERVQQLKTILMCIMQMYPSDAKSQMARSRLSSLMF